MSFETLDSKTVFEGKIISVDVDTISLPDKNSAYREKICTNDGVGVIALNENDEVLLVKQYRYAMGIYTLEIPAGKMENGEDIYESALRELREETGYAASKLTKPSPNMPMAAICTETVHLFMGDYKDMTFVGTDFDEDEFIEIVKIPLEKAVDMVMNGEIPDGKTQTLILRVAEMKRRGIIGGGKE